MPRQWILAKIGVILTSVKKTSLETPIATVGEFAFLEVTSVNSIGAFLDWGLSKELLLPFAEQTRNLRPGQKVAVFIYIDNSGRTAASMRLDRHVAKTGGDYKPNQKVDLFVYAKTDLGFKAIINGSHTGLIYADEVFQDLAYGQRLPGYIKTVREDGKIDLSLQALGSFGAGDLGEKILEVLKAQGGFLAVNDKTPAEIIYEQFGVSKKKFKMAVGGLYKKRLITISDEGIHLVSESPGGPLHR